MKQLGAVILDLGNVLVFHDNEKLFTEMAKTFGCSKEEFKAKLEPDFWDRVNRGQVKGDALRLALEERMGGQVSAAEFTRVWSCHFTLNVPMLPLVDALKDQTRLVLLSNTHDLHFTFLRPQLPVLQHFRGVVLSCEVGCVKPEPEIFARAVELAGCPPEACVFFDDLAPYVQAAQRQGLNAHVYTDAAAFAQTLKNYRF
ncbi:MAG: HAD family phosphatase [Myxococcaceae bacterium]|nr:HAD family phosphatase [Myxococcaceae bacterium]